MENKFKVGTILKHIDLNSYVTVHNCIDHKLFNGMGRIDDDIAYKSPDNILVELCSNWTDDVTDDEKAKYIARLLEYEYMYDITSNTYVHITTVTNGALESTAKANVPIIPIIEVEGCKFEESTYIYNGKRWSADDLYMYARHNDLPVFDLPLAAINLTLKPFRINDMYDLISHIIRVKQCDCDIPIILDDLGQIADGVHRVCKAIVEGRPTIKAIRLPKMPQSTIPID